MKIISFFLTIITVLWLLWVMIFIYFFIHSESQETSKVFLVKHTLEVYAQALQNYFIDNELYPTTFQGLQTLVTRPKLPPFPKNYPLKGYIEKLALTDPWGTPYQYTYQFSHGKHQIVIVSLGADGQPGGKGYHADIIKVIETKTRQK